MDGAHVEDVGLWTAIERVDAQRGCVRPGGQAEAACAGAVLVEVLEDELLDDDVLDDEDVSDAVLEDDDSALTLDFSAARLSVR